MIFYLFGYWLHSFKLSYSRLAKFQNDLVVDFKNSKTYPISRFVMSQQISKSNTVREPSENLKVLGGSQGQD